MKLSKTKIKKAIENSQNFIDNAKNKEKFTDTGLTIYGCEVRNLEAYETMLEYDTEAELKDFDEWHLSLYKAI